MAFSEWGERDWYSIYPSPLPSENRYKRIWRPAYPSKRCSGTNWLLLRSWCQSLPLSMVRLTPHIKTDASPRFPSYDLSEMRHAVSICNLGKPKRYGV